MEINYLDAFRSGWLDAQHKRVASAAIILENEAGAVLAVKAKYKNYWTIPGGIVDAGETPQEAAIRETLEEVGIEIAPEILEFVAVVSRRSNDAMTYQFIFKAPLVAPVVDHIALQASELEAYAFMTKEQVMMSEKECGKTLQYWAADMTGYIEQTLGK